MTKSRSINDIKPGTVIENNDPRKRGERHEIVAVANGYIYYQAGVRRARVRLDRILPPGQRNANGWSVAVEPAYQARVGTPGAGKIESNEQIADAIRGVTA
jgi:hypothetical protein